MKNPCLNSGIDLNCLKILERNFYSKLFLTKCKLVRQSAEKYWKLAFKFISSLERSSTKNCLEMLFRFMQGNEKYLEHLEQQTVNGGLIGGTFKIWKPT